MLAFDAGKRTKMKVEPFTTNKRVTAALATLQAYWQKTGKQVSDILDEDGHQYVDLVMEGGGVLGIALVGYTYALESVGIRFLGVGGTSAGAINAMLVAAVETPANAKSTKILEIMADLDMFEFVDGDADVKDFVESLVNGAGPVKLSFKAMQVVDSMLEHLGLNPGRAFQTWLSRNLKNCGVRTLDDLNRRIRTIPGSMRLRGGKKIDLKAADPKIAVVSADISTETKVVFPEMAALYFKDPAAVDPALFVRASMSIPGFFRPLRLRNLPRGPEARRRWDKMAGYRGRPPGEVYFVDGGIMSNFPIDLFHCPGVPAAPTFGVKLGTDRMAPHIIKKPSQMLGAVFNSARHCADYDFLIKNPDYRQIMGYINTGPHNWLNFFIRDKDKIDLFVRGVETAVGFLQSFDWKAYKSLRRKLK
jgi:NTE family protein